MAWKERFLSLERSAVRLGPWNSECAMTSQFTLDGINHHCMFATAHPIEYRISRWFGQIESLRDDVRWSPGVLWHQLVDTRNQCF